jgi:hypothetical protein
MNSLHTARSRGLSAADGKGGAYAGEDGHYDLEPEHTAADPKARPHRECRLARMRRVNREAVLGCRCGG